MTDARQDRYVREILTLYRQTPGTRGRATTADRRLAEDLHRRGVPAELVRAALLLATARRTARPSDAAPLQTVNSLHYFLPVLRELQQHPPDPAYLDYLASRARPSNHQRPGRPPSKSLIMAPSFIEAPLTPPKANITLLSRPPSTNRSAILPGNLFRRSASPSPSALPSSPGS